MFVINCIKHAKTIVLHKKEVLKLSIIAGIPFQGLIHDLSKFSPSEFIESAKYFQGNRSPIMACKEDKGYSIAWQHHKGRNKHHAEWWVDKLYAGGEPIKIEYKYIVEMCIDIIAASKTYNGENFKPNMPYDYWIEKLTKTTLMHNQSQLFVKTVLKNYSKYGNKALNPLFTKKLYKSITKKYQNNQNQD